MFTLMFVVMSSFAAVSVCACVPVRQLRSAHVRQLRVPRLGAEHRLGARPLPMLAHPHHHGRHVLLQGGQLRRK